MRRIAALILPFLAAVTAPALAQELAYEIIFEEVVVEEVEVEEVVAERFVSTPSAPIPQGIAAFGPFRVLDDARAAIVAVTDGASPAQFTAMLRAHPGIRVIEMVECPGTEDDRANLQLGRMIRARGIATHVPDGGSVRSGGVELFLAGFNHTAAPGAEFAVHSWADEDGREPSDYAPDAPENRAYLDYYREMGMNAGQAAEFYAMTNSVPFSQAKWLTAADMGRWVNLHRANP